MPLHDFRCTDCAQVFEALVRGAVPPNCPKCGGVALEKLLSAPVAPGWSKAATGRAREAAARAGHFSHYRKGER